MTHEDRPTKDPDRRLPLRGVPRRVRRRATPLSNQADVRSIDALKDFRAVLALYSEEAQGALGAVKMEARRTVRWLAERKIYWSDQIKRRREQVSSARAEVARRRLAKNGENTPAMSEQKELLRKAEAALRDAEMKAVLIKKWEPALQLAVLELHAGIRRISDLSSTDVARASFLLGRLVDALEAYMRETPPAALSQFGGQALSSISAAIVAEEVAKDEEEAANPTAPDPDAEGADALLDPSPDLDPVEPPG
jgi:hypothetical protein